MSCLSVADFFNDLDNSDTLSCGAPCTGKKVSGVEVFNEACWVVPLSWFSVTFCAAEICASPDRAVVLVVSVGVVDADWVVAGGEFASVLSTVLEPDEVQALKPIAKRPRNTMRGEIILLTTLPLTPACTVTSGQ